jgi:hypothetical protein
MRYFSTVIGGAICGALCFGIWPEMWKSYGIMGGWITATVVIGICWYMNHWLGVIWNQPGRIWVDQGWAVSAAGISWTMVRFNSQFQRALPAVCCCMLGGALAGIAAVQVKRRHLAMADSSPTPGPESGSHV